MINNDVRSLVVCNSNIFAGTLLNGIYISTNNGINWVQTSLYNRQVHSLAISDSNIYAGTNNGVYISSDNGTTWTLTSLNYMTFSLTISESNLFAGTQYNGVYLSTNNGINWIQKNEGLGDSTIMAFVILNYKIFAGSFGNFSVWRRPLSELVGIKNTGYNSPDDYKLEQNNPNPFNPITTIKYQIPKSSFIVLKVYDVLGKEIAILVKEKLNAGSHEVDWNGTGYPSGVYFYKLTTNEFSDVKKMILIK